MCLQMTTTVTQVRKVKEKSLIPLETHSATPSVRSVISDLTSSLPGVLAGCGAAGDCLSETGAVVAATVAPDVAVVSLVGSSAGAGDG